MFLRRGLANWLLHLPSPRPDSSITITPTRRTIMATLTRKATDRDRGIWPGGEPASVRAAADAMAEKVGKTIPSPADEADTPDRIVSPSPVDGLMSLAVDLLREATDLPRPADVHISATGQRISCLFDSGLASYGALWQWADLFGSTVEMSRSSRKGRRLVSVSFTYNGAAVEAYAYI
jgi:hypothetical protein